MPTVKISRIYTTLEISLLLQSADDGNQKLVTAIFGYHRLQKCHCGGARTQCSPKPPRWISGGRFASAKGKQGTEGLWREVNKEEIKWGKGKNGQGRGRKGRGKKESVMSPSEISFKNTLDS